MPHIIVRRQRPESWRVAEAVKLTEGALDGSSPHARVWDDADHLCAILAVLTGDGGRARVALLKRRSLERAEAYETGEDPR